MVEHSYRLWDPWDYLSLFYIIFFGDWDDVPQPSWKIFSGGGEVVRRSKRLQQATLISQALILTVGLTGLVGWAVEILSGHFDWRQAALGVAGGVALGVAGGVALGVAGGVALGVAGGIAFGVAGGVALGVAFGIAFGAAGGVALGVALGVAVSVTVGVADGVALGVALGVAFGAAVSTVIGVFSGTLRTYTETQDMMYGVLGFILGYFLIAALGVLFRKRKHRHLWSEWLESALFLCLMSPVAGWFLAWQSQEWSDQTISPVVLTGVSILVFTRAPLWPPEAIWSSLSCWRLGRRAHLSKIDGWEMAEGIRRACFDRQMPLPLPGEAKALWKLSELHEELAIREAVELARESNHRLVAIATLRRLAAKNPLAVRHSMEYGFWYHMGKRDDRDRNLRYIAYRLPEAAARAWTANEQLIRIAEQARSKKLQNPSKTYFPDVLRELHQVTNAFSVSLDWQGDLRHVDTHLALYGTLQSALETENETAVADFQEPQLPSTAPELYPKELLKALKEISTIVRRARGYVKATSPVTRGKHLLKIQAALEEIGPVVERVPSPAGPLLALVIAHWRRLFAEAGGELVRGQAAGPFPQPYVIANPVVGDSFVGREDVLRRLEALWAVEGQRPSVVLYGHRRMGKTSILQNLKGEQFGPNTRIVDFNLQTFGLVPSTGALLHNLAMELHATCDEPAFSPPDEAPFDREPYGAFRRFLRQLERHCGETRYIVTLDEVETIERGIRAGKLQDDLIEYLRGVITTQTWLTLAFAGLHTLRQMTEDYWNPLFGSVETIPVSFLTEGATRRLLTAPSPDFAVDYSPDVLDRVYTLTFGQPYLTQLVGHSLITRLNEEMFEKQVEREARFNLDDVEAVISSDAFFRTGGAYFTGIWAQAGEGPPGTQDVLKALAEEPASASEIEASSGLDADAVRIALERLAHHDIVVEDGGRWRCRVELMRWWLGRSLT